MSDTIDELESGPSGKTNPIGFVLIGILFYNGLMYAEPTLLSLEYYLYEMDFPNHFQYWMVFIVKIATSLLFANYAANWIVKNMYRLNSVRLLMSFVVFFITSFGLNPN